MLRKLKPLGSVIVNTYKCGSYKHRHGYIISKLKYYVNRNNIQPF